MVFTVSVSLYGVFGLDYDLAVSKQSTKCNETACVIKNFNSEIKPHHFVSECKADKINIITFVDNDLCEEFPIELFETTRSLRFLSLNDSLIEEIQTGNFKHATALEELHLANGFIKNLPVNVFDGAFSLMIIDLNKNRIRTLDPEVFKKLYHLKTINLAENQIQDLDKNLFSENSKLNTINLSKNKLLELDMNIFYSCKALTWLYLQNNQLTKLHLRNKYNNLYWLNAEINEITELRLDVDQIKNREAFIYITANHNRISKLKISPQYNVRNLYLEHNKYIDLYEIMAMSSLIDLRLGNNNLSHVSSTTFNNLRHLEILYLHNTNLPTIKVNMFENQRKLKLLHIGYNNIGMIDLRFLAALKKLETLYIDGNALTDLNTADINVHLPALQKIELRENEWKCDKLKIIMNYLKAYNIQLISTESFQDTNVDGIICVDDQKEIDLLKNQINILENKLKQLVEVYNDNFCMLKDLSCCNFKSLTIFAYKKSAHNSTNDTKIIAEKNFNRTCSI